MPLMLAATSLLAPSRASAQLLAGDDSPIVYGHHHLNVSDIAAHKKFWADSLGGTVVRIGTDNQEVIRIPNVWIFLRSQTPTAGSKGSTVDHLSLSVPDLQATLNKVRANGFRVATAEEATGPGTASVSGDIAVGLRGSRVGIVFGPDDAKVELIEEKGQAEPVKLHHIHFMGDQNASMREWYVKTLGVTAPVMRPDAAFLTSNLPGVLLNFSPSPTAPSATSGRVYDHIGFEVQNLAALLARLEAQGIIPTVSRHRDDALNIDFAFLTDPWGTRIELTEGLRRIRSQ